MKPLAILDWLARSLFLAVLLCAAPFVSQVSAQTLNKPILYVTQVPVISSSNTVVSIAGSHLCDTRAAPRGGDLMICYPDGTKKNLTRIAGYGTSANLQTGEAIAVRDPMVHWNGQRALFSMVIGAPSDANDTTEYCWQIYEVEGLGKDDTPIIRKIAGQREDFNNIQPTYTSSEQLIYVSDQTINGGRNLYPALNEQGGESVTGLWSLDPGTSKLALIDHSPSGSFKPFVDSYGRVVFSRWDHLQRDAEAEHMDAIDFASEDPGASSTDVWRDVFPEPLTDTATSFGHKFDLFLPWTIKQDGTGLLTMNHLGRHELSPDARRGRPDANLVDFNTPDSPVAPAVSSLTRAGSYLQIVESKTIRGKYTATDAISTAVSAGRLVSFDSPPTKNPDLVNVKVTNNSGLARDPSYLDDGRLMGSFVNGPMLVDTYGRLTQTPGPIGHGFVPGSNNPFRVRIANGSADLSSGGNPIPVTNVTRTNYIAGSQVTFSGPLWQLQPVEVTTSVTPVPESTSLPEPETKMLGEAGVSPSALKRWLKENNMALLVSRNVTSRDDNDNQQPFSLRVPGGTGSWTGEPSYRVTHLQFFQGDYVRSYQPGGIADPSVGRRVTPRVLHDDKGANIPTQVPGSAKIAPEDGSTAIFVPAGRALTWQLTDSEGKAVVRERYWLNFRAGEIRSCTNCHANNTADQLGRPDFTNPPIALRELLTDWKRRHPEADASVTPYEFWAERNIAPGTPADGDVNGDGLSNFEAYVYGFGVEGTVASDPLAKSFTPSVKDSGDESYAQLAFTLNLKATRLRVSIESSADLKDWNEVAVIEEGIRTTDGSVDLKTVTSPALADRDLEQIMVESTAPLSSIGSAYFRLVFEEL